MKLQRLTTWVIIIALIFGLAGIGWNLVDLRESGITQSNTQGGTKDSRENSATVISCDDLRTFITKEEKASYSLWKKYHRQVMIFAEGLPKNERAAKVSELASSVTVVLESDLRIYRQMKKLPQCLDRKFREQVQEWIDTTREMINYYNGEGELDGDRFDPEEGIWDTSFYDVFYSATDNLITGLQNI